MTEPSQRKYIDVDRELTDAKPTDDGPPVLAAPGQLTAFPAAVLSDAPRQARHVRGLTLRNRRANLILAGSFAAIILGACMLGYAVGQRCPRVILSSQATGASWPTPAQVFANIGSPEKTSDGTLVWQSIDNEAAVKMTPTMISGIFDANGASFETTQGMKQALRILQYCDTFGRNCFPTWNGADLSLASIASACAPGRTVHFYHDDIKATITSNRYMEITIERE